MKPFYFFLLLFLLLSKTNFSQEYPDEITFYSNGSTFSPLIYAETNAVILWTFDDNTTSSSANPIKDYGTELLRKNRLKVTPWSAVRGINIGYDGSQGGSDTIFHIPDQKISKVQNLNLVSNYLRLWCSSYNLIDSLIFDSFIYIETVESFTSATVKYISLVNTPNLKRLCVENNNLNELDLSHCTVLRDIRASGNNYTDIIFPDNLPHVEHICIQANPQIVNPALFSNMSKFPYVSELLIYNCNQNGMFAVHQSISDNIFIDATSNNYTSIDFSGALQNENGEAVISLDNNNISSINLVGCDQIRSLKLNSNNLSADSVDKVLQQLDAFGTMNGYVDLRANAIPTSIGFSHASNLITKNWTVLTEGATSISEDSSFTPLKFELSQNYPNPFNPETMIIYQLPNESNVVIKIYDILGSEVTELVNEKKEAGVYEIKFNAENLSSGIYLYRLQVGDPSSNSRLSFVEIKKMTLLK